MTAIMYSALTVFHVLFEENLVRPYHTIAG